MTPRAGTALRQRSDLTFRPNLQGGRHAWLRLTPAYAVKVVEEILARESRPRRILDPFCGTGTTALSAACHGQAAVTTDINPFLVWLARAKTAQYAPAEVEAARQAGAHCLEILARGGGPAAAPPPIHNIERWWPAGEAAFLCRLLGAVREVAVEGSAARTLLGVAFCRTLIRLSNAAFNHQSMSFRPPSEEAAGPAEHAAQFADALAAILDGAARNPPGRSEVRLMDARALRDLGGPFDAVITSPPYVNRMSYVRELRPYMYWLGFLAQSRDAGELDWRAIGGTWGVATTRLAAWSGDPDGYASPRLRAVVGAIAAADGRSGRILAAYVERYFQDVWRHLSCLPGLLRPGARVHYIIGNSSFYGCLVPAEQLYAEMLAGLGFRGLDVRPIRKRNSKRELVEFEVSATWG